MDEVGDFSRTWSDYVRQRLGEQGKVTNEQVGDVVGLSGTMVGNWLRAQGFSKPSADKVIAFWEKFGGNTTLPEAMAAAGYAQVETYDTVVRTRPDPALLDIDELLEEVRKRAAAPLATATKPEEVRRAGRKRLRDTIRPDSPNL